MRKVLRSLLQEKFPLDLRVQIELISKRRDIHNKEKQEEIIKLLQENDVGNVVQLGPGTNRYAFKIDGFVVKVATDHDGKIDNLKEFKMAKRLYPYVTKTYEVSQNGTLLVAEYVPPFESYTEMCRYAERIREILKELSAVYLIGDVGITAKNYANWGIRVGTNEPVCLDFAYVYEVSSDLFVCRHCKTNSMLIPNKDFTGLYCSNPSCGHKYLFEDIRARIGNDVHRHEIGDLTEEGYALTESFVDTELDEERSNYLAKQVKPKTIKEEDDMSKKEHEYASAVQGEEFAPTVTYMIPISKAEPDEAAHEEFVPEVISEKMNADISPTAVFTVPASKPEGEDDMEVEGDGIVTSQKPVFTPAVNIVEEEGEPEPADGKGHGGPTDYETEDTETETNTADAEEESEEEVETAETVVQELNSADQNGRVLTEESVTIPSTAEKADLSDISPIDIDMINAFHYDATSIVSKLSNKIGSYCRATDLFANVNAFLPKDTYPETFYKAVQNAVFRSLMIFMEFDFREEPNRHGNGTHKAFYPTTDFLEQPYRDTALFIARLWDTHFIAEESVNVMSLYRSMFSDHDGIQPEWKKVFVERLQVKTDYDDYCAWRIADIIGTVWCVNNGWTKEDLADPTIGVDVAPTVDRITMGEEKADEPPIIPDEEDGEETVESYPIDHDPQYDLDHSDEEIEQAEEDNIVNLMVQVYPHGDDSIIRLTSVDELGQTVIPFYANIENRTDSVPSLADDRNGMWDWLIHQMPDLMFRTKDPDKYLAGNDDPIEEDQVHVVIMDHDRDGYIMGVYSVDGIYDMIPAADGEEEQAVLITNKDRLAKIFKVLRDDTAYTSISHLHKTMSENAVIMPEAEILAQIGISEDSDDDSEEENEQESAAIAALMDESTQETATEAPQPEPKTITPGAIPVMHRKDAKK